MCISIESSDWTFSTVSTEVNTPDSMAHTDAMDIFLTVMGLDIMIQLPLLVGMPKTLGLQKQIEAQ